MTPHSSPRPVPARLAPDAAARLNRHVALASITIASLLAMLKGWAAWRTGSTAMLSSFADTGLDLVASLATLAGVWVAGQPADTNHRFGHGKAEALAALFQVVLIAISVLALGYHAVDDIIAGTHPETVGDGLIVSAVAILATFALLAWQRYVIARTASIAIHTDHLHYRADLALNIAVIVALLLNSWWRLADPVFGLGIAVWLLWSAWSALQGVMVQLMDEEWPEAKRARFLAVLAGIPELRGVHDLRTRTSGNHDFVQFHVWVDPAMTVAAAHDVMDAIEAKIHAAFPEVEIFIHPDPEGLVDERGLAAKDELASVLEVPLLG